MLWHIDHDSEDEWGTIDTQFKDIITLFISYSASYLTLMIANKFIERAPMNPESHVLIEQLITPTQAH